VQGVQRASALRCLNDPTDWRFEPSIRRDPCCEQHPCRPTAAEHARAAQAGSNASARSMLPPRPAPPEAFHPIRHLFAELIGIKNPTRFIEYIHSSAETLSKQQ